MQPIIDTHVHTWDLSRADYPWLQGDSSLLNRSYLLPELEEERKRTNVIAGVLVQAAGNSNDTEAMMEVAEETDWIKGVVGWLPLTDPETTRQLLEKNYAGRPYFKGVRHQVHDEKDPQWLLQSTVIESLQILAAHNIPYDLVGVLPVHIETAIAVAERVPGLRIVFDHLNQPPIAKKEQLGAWGMAMKSAARHANLHAKISGLGTTTGKPGSWTANDLQPYIAFILEQFGVDRCFCGGDWPVSLLAGSYSKTWQAYEQAADKLLNKAEKEKIFYTNAKAFYNLSM